MEAANSYAWEGDVERSWEALDAGEETVTAAERTIALERARKRQQPTDSSSIRRGMIRYFYIIIDMSSAMNQTDLKPHRLSVTLAFLQDFVQLYFDQNPLSQIGFICTRGSKAEKMTDLATNPKSHRHVLGSKIRTDGEASLQLSLEMAKDFLSTIPAYGNREVLVIYSSLSTCDPGNIHDTISSMKKENIRCSTISLSAELYILKELAEQTNGSFRVAINKEHFRRLLGEHVCPPPIPKVETSKPMLFKMGFPARRVTANGTATLCGDGSFQSVGYFCPRCKSRAAELPATCEVCSLPLVSSAHLARSYHHLFPVKVFEEMPQPVTSGPAPSLCGGMRLALVPFTHHATNISEHFDEATATKLAGRMWGDQLRLKLFPPPPPAAAQASSNGGSAPPALVSRRRFAEELAQAPMSCLSCTKALAPHRMIRLRCPDCENVFCLDCDVFLHEHVHNCPGCLSKQQFT